MVSSAPLPDDLIEEVFYRLPINSIFRFKSLSKNWLTKISDHRFARRYNSQGGGSWGLFLQQTSVVGTPLQFISITDDAQLDKSHTPPRLSLDFLPHPIVYVVATSNDLVLCSPTEVCQTLYYVCNPITKKWVSLTLSLQFQSIRVSFSSIVDDYERGLEFTVVRAFVDSSTSPGSFEIETFSSSSGEWAPPKEVSYPFLPPRFFLFKGTLYWLDREQQIMVAYDLAEDHIRSIALPGDRQNYPFSNPMERFVGVSKEQLQYMEVSNTRFIFCVWVLDDPKKGGWSLEHSIGFQSIVARNPPILHEQLHLIEDEFLGDETYIEPLIFHPLDKNVVVLRVGNRILSYNFANERLQNLWSLSSAPIGIYQSTVFFPYLQTPWPTRIPTPSWKTPAVVIDSSAVCSRVQPLVRQRLRRLRME